MLLLYSWKYNPISGYDLIILIFGGISWLIEDGYMPILQFFFFPIHTCLFESDEMILGKTLREVYNRFPLNFEKGFNLLMTQGPQFVVTRWNGVALWSWEMEQDVCAICKNSLVDPCVQCQANETSGEGGCPAVFVSWFLTPGSVQPRFPPSLYLKMDRDKSNVSTWWATMARS